MLKLRKLNAETANFGEIMEKYLEVKLYGNEIFSDLSAFKKLISFLVDFVEEPSDRVEAEREIKKLSAKKMFELLQEIGGAATEPSVPLESNSN